MKKISQSLLLLVLVLGIVSFVSVSLVGCGQKANPTPVPSVIGNPTNVSLTREATGIKISWTNTSDATLVGVKIYYSKTATPTATTGTIVTTETGAASAVKSYIHTGTTTTDTYYYTLYSYNSAGTLSSGKSIQLASQEVSQALSTDTYDSLATTTAQIAVNASTLGQSMASMGNMGSGSMTSSSINSRSIRMLAGDAPPASFFLPLPADGHFAPPGRFPGNATVEMTLLTLQGDAVTPAWLNGKMVAFLEPISWAQMSSEATRPIDAQWQAAIMNIVNNGCKPTGWITFESSTVTLWDYITWAEMAPMMKDNILRSIPSSEGVTSIEAFTKLADGTDVTTTDAITKYSQGGSIGTIHVVQGNMEMKLNTNVSFEYNTALGHPAPYAMHATGVSTMDVSSTETVTMTVTQQNVIHVTGTGPETMTGVMTMEGYMTTGTTESLVKIVMVMASDGTQDGDMYLEGTKIGIMHLAADGSGWWEDIATGVRTTFAAPTT